MAVVGAGPVVHAAPVNDHELGFTAFLAEPGRRRMRTLLELGPKRRPRVRALLAHSVTLDPRYAQPAHVGVEALLMERGAPATCFVISAGRDCDGKEMPLVDGLAAIDGCGGFVSCIAGRLGYYSYENRGHGFLLTR
jgi:hypothetical protein